MPQFGNHIGDGLRSGRKVMARKLVGPKMVAYYPEDVFRNDPLLANLEAERYENVCNFCWIVYMYSIIINRYLLPLRSYVGQNTSWRGWEDVAKHLQRKVLVNEQPRRNECNVYIPFPCKIYETRQLCMFVFIPRCRNLVYVCWWSYNCNCNSWDSSVWPSCFWW